MDRKPAAKKKTARAMAKVAKRKRSPAARTMVSAKTIKAGRDIIMGDQKNIIDNRRQIAHVASPAEFVAELQKLQAQIAALKQERQITPAQVQAVEVVEGQVKEVIEEAQKPQPLGARITAALTGAQAVLGSMAGSVTAAVGLGATLAGLGQIALKLFGG